MGKLRRQGLDRGGRNWKNRAGAREWGDREGRVSVGGCRAGTVSALNVINYHNCVMCVSPFWLLMSPTR